MNIMVKDKIVFCSYFSLQSVIHIPGLSLQDTHVVIRDSFALVNTSLSEGMAISILEVGFIFFFIFE